MGRFFSFIQSGKKKSIGFKLGNLAGLCSRISSWRNYIDSLGIFLCRIHFTKLFYKTHTKLLLSFAFNEMN